MSNDGIYFQCRYLKIFMLHDEVFCIYCGKYHEYMLLCHACVNIQIEEGLKKRAAKTPQHGHRYSNILMLYNIINTYG